MHSLTSNTIVYTDQCIRPCAVTAVTKQLFIPTALDSSRKQTPAVNPKPRRSVHMQPSQLNKAKPMYRVARYEYEKKIVGGTGRPWRRWQSLDFSVGNSETLLRGFCFLAKPLLLLTACRGFSVGHGCGCTAGLFALVEMSLAYEIISKL